LAQGVHRLEPKRPLWKAVAEPHLCPMMNSDERAFVGNQLLKDAEREVRMGFVRKVYGILTAQLLLTVAVAAPLSQAQVFVRNNSWLLGLSAVVTLSTICAMSCCHNLARKFPVNYIFVMLFTFFEGVLIGFVSAEYTAQSVVLAASVTVLIFACMTIYAWNTRTDFTGFGPYLYGALIAMCCFGFVLTILSLCGVRIDWAVMLYDLIGIVLFTFYIVFDTQMILGGTHKVQFVIDDYVFAALNLYLDIINLFLHLLRLLGDRRDR